MSKRHLPNQYSQSFSNQPERNKTVDKQQQQQQQQQQQKTAERVSRVKDK